MSYVLFCYSHWLRLIVQPKNACQIELLREDFFFVLQRYGKRQMTPWGRYLLYIAALKMAQAMSPKMREKYNIHF